MRSSPLRVVPVSVLVALAACSDPGPNPVAPIDGSVALSRETAQGEVLSHAIIHPTVESMARLRARATGSATSSSNLYYHGGTGWIGVETAPRVYIVVWGAQWNSASGDPSGEVTRMRDFLKAVGGSPWLNSVTQYCQGQGIASGSSSCSGVSAGSFAGNPSGIYTDNNLWYDTGSAAPSHPTQSQLASEAVRAAAHFGNTASGSNVSTQYVILTATGNSSSGFKTQYCAYHSSTSSSYGNVAYTNLPYITDAGASCGANFVNPGSAGLTDGITIVGGHELGETISDQFPSTGWLDSGGKENGDKCAWISSGQGASANITLGTRTFPVQSLWSNAFNGNAGGCVLSYP